MDIEMLKLFENLVRTGNITRAANDQFITQSAASKRLKMLEKELGVNLIRRGKGQSHVELTPAGESFATIAERMLQLYEESLELKHNVESRILVIACLNSIQNYTLPPFLAAFQKDNPNIHFSLEDHHSPEILNLLLERRVDIGIMQGTPVHSSNLKSTLLYQENYRVVIRRSADCPPRGSKIHPEDLHVENEIYQDFGVSLQQWHDTHWRPSGAKIRVNTTSTALQYLRTHEDWMLVPDSVAWKLAQGDFQSYALTTKTPNHPIYAVWRSQSHDPSVTRFIEQAEQYFHTEKLWDWHDNPMSSETE